MIKIEAVTLEEAYLDAASSLACSVTELTVEVVQHPSNGFLGLFKKSAIIVATKKMQESSDSEVEKEIKPKQKQKKDTKPTPAPQPKKNIKQEKATKKSPPKKEETKVKEKKIVEDKTHTMLNDTIMPQSFVSMQDEDEDEDVSSYLADYDDEFDNSDGEDLKSTTDIAALVQVEINKLFSSICFKIDKIEVKVYDENTLLVEFKGEDAALLIGKEGYRYKALSYMIFNWINTKYQLQLRLEIAEFLKNQEESVARYLTGVKESVNRDGRAQTKILDGVLVQIALRELRDIYPDKYVAIRSTRDGLKYIIINDYHSN